MGRLAGALLLLCLWIAPAWSQAIISQVHNAPGWLHSTTYSTSGVHKVNNGLGWSESTGKWVPYATLNAYKLSASSPSPCTSAATQSTSWGTGTGITDGTCKWDWMSVTDYVTLTGWGMDAPAWTAQPYGYKEVVAAPDVNGILTMYQNDNSTGCVGSANPPTVTARACGYNVAGNCNSTVAPPNNPGTDGCTWIARVAITYSSGTSHVPKQTRIASNWFFSTVSQPYQANLWNDQQYVMGSNGETSSYFVLTENWFTEGHNINAVGNPACGQTAGVKVDVAWPTPCAYNITAAPGESFTDTLAANPSLPLRYDPSYGVSIVGQVNAGNFFVNWKGLQMFNPNGQAITGFGRDADVFIMENLIVEVGTSSVAVGAPWSLGDNISVGNSLIISHGPDAIGFESIYAGAISHSTVVNPEGTGNTCIFHKWNWVWTQGQIISNTICAGFAHSNGGIGNNATGDPGFVYYNSDPLQIGLGTPPNAYSTSPFEPGNPFVFNSPFSVQWAGPSNNEYGVLGMTYGVSPSGLFMGANDYRIAPTSPLRAAGANYGNINISFEQFGGAPVFNVNYDAADVLGTARPATGQDIGAWQTPGAPPTTFDLTVTAPSNGTITGTGGINCGITCTHTFVSGATVVLTATPSPGFHFNQWSGACSGSPSPCSFSMTANQSAGVQFLPDSNPISNRIARLVVRQPSQGGGGSPPLLQMPPGITGSQTVEVGSGVNTITMQFSKANVGLPNNSFVLSISPDATNWTQITDTVNPMTVTGGYTLPDFFYDPQTFILHGNWGSAQFVQFIRVAQTAAGSLNAMYTDQMQYDSTNFTYLGPSTSGNNSPTQGYTNGNGAGISPLIWSTCFSDTVPAPPSGGPGSWVDCPPNYSATPSLISGATVDGTPVATGTLNQIIDPAGGGHDVVLPAGRFFGTGLMGQFNSGTVSGNRVHGQGQGVTVIDGHGIGPTGGKGLFDLETYVITLTDLTVNGSIIGGNADNKNASSNAGCLFLAFAGYHFDNIELTQCQDGIRGNAVGDPTTVSNAYIHNNGSRTGFTHELYLQGGDHFFTLNNTKIVAGDRPGYALKVRFKTVVNGGYFSSCTDPTAQTCAGLLDFPNGDTIAIQGLNTVTVGGTIHTGDVLTMTFQHLSDTPIVVTSTVAAGPPTAQAATNALLAALQGNSALATAGWGFHAGMPVGGDAGGGNGTSIGGVGSSAIPNAIDLYAPYRLADWTITPSVTGTGHTTTLTQTSTPVTLLLNSNAQVANGSTQVVKCEEEFGPGGGGAACIMNLNNVIIDNRNSNAPRIGVGQWDSTPGMPGTILNITNCVYTGGIAPQITSNWQTVNGSCTPAP